MSTAATSSRLPAKMTTIPERYARLFPLLWQRLPVEDRNAIMRRGNVRLCADEPCQATLRARDALAHYHFDPAEHTQTICVERGKGVRLSDAALVGLLAHELAHAYLGVISAPDRSERAAISQAIAWGLSDETDALFDEDEKLGRAKFQ
jgi:hypothetical protein